MSKKSPDFFNGVYPINHVYNGLSFKKFKPVLSKGYKKGSAGRGRA
jgi:hypothetical protein